MDLQDVVWFIALAGMGLVALGFILVISQAGKPAGDEARAKAARTARRWQGRLFGALVVVFVVGTWGTLRHYPIPPQHSALPAAQVVAVNGMQWFWQIKPDTVRAGSAVEFNVTSADVNHGFAIYGLDGRILAQTQAMPGYTNKLMYTFTAPGKYTVRCLEFCGAGHAPMAADITVLAAGGN
jgi:cytochrome c oxidase subunit 2